jgi:hypothetical protein
MKNMANMKYVPEEELSKKPSGLAGMGKTIQIVTSVTDCIERIDCALAMELQELWDEAYQDGIASRDFEVRALQESLDTLKKKVNAILTALA